MDTVQYASITGVEDNLSRQTRHPEYTLALCVAVDLPGPRPGLLLVAEHPGLWSRLRAGRIIAVRPRPDSEHVVTYADDLSRERQLAGLVAQRAAQGLLPDPGETTELRPATLLAVRRGTRTVGRHTEMLFDVEGRGGEHHQARGFHLPEELAGHRPGTPVRIRPGTPPILWPDLELVTLSRQPRSEPGTA